MIKSRALLFLLSFAWLPMQQDALVIEQIKKYPESSSLNVEFIDLGETDLPVNLLNAFALPISYAPKINDQGQVTCNQSLFGEIKGASADSLSPQIGWIKSNCFDLNNNGDIILGFNRPHHDVEWRIWSQKNFTTTGSINIEHDQLPGIDIHLRAINDDKMAVGLFKPSGMLRPVVWTPEKGLHHLGYYLGWDIPGVIWNVNNSGWIVGYVDEDAKKVPFMWSKTAGLNKLMHFANLWKEAACAKLASTPQFADLVISEKNILFGTFWPDAENQTGLTSAFWWDPQSDSLRKIDLQGMRINAISPSDTFVGSWNGQAALCDLGNKPSLLSDMIKGLNPQWNLLDATDINSQGDIVGYGLYQGKPHYFMLKVSKPSYCQNLPI